MNFPVKLTNRELEVLHLLIKGKTSKEIGEKLGISYETVRSHRRNMMYKTNTTNASQLIYVSTKAQLI